MALVALLAAWGLGVWVTSRRGSVHEVTGIFVVRVGEDSILVQHDAVPPLDMRAMEFMAIRVEPREILGRERLARGDRIRLLVRQRPEGLVATRIDKLHD